MPNADVLDPIDKPQPPQTQLSKDASLSRSDTFPDRASPLRTSSASADEDGMGVGLGLEPSTAIVDVRELLQCNTRDNVLIAQKDKQDHARNGKQVESRSRRLYTDRNMTQNSIGTSGSGAGIYLENDVGLSLVADPGSSSRLISNNGDVSSRFKNIGKNEVLMEPLKVHQTGEENRRSVLVSCDVHIQRKGFWATSRVPFWVESLSLSSCFVVSIT